MSRLIAWLDHRTEVVGFQDWRELSEFAGVPLRSLRQARAADALDELESSQRWALAAALRVSPQHLERLNAGKIRWIEDAHVCDVSGQHRSWRRQEEMLGEQPIDYATPTDRGTPLIGRIRADGRVEPDEDWNEEWGRRLPARVGSGGDVYALEVEGTGESIVFRNVPVWEFRQGMAAVYIWNGWQSDGWYGRVDLAPARARAVTIDGVRHDLDMPSLVRIGKVMER